MQTPVKKSPGEIKDNAKYYSKMCNKVGLQWYGYQRDNGQLIVRRSFAHCIQSDMAMMTAVHDRECFGPWDVETRREAVEELKLALENKKYEQRG